MKYTKSQQNILDHLQYGYGLDIEKHKTNAITKIVLDEDGNVIYFELPNGTLTEQTPCEKGDFDAILDRLISWTCYFYGGIQTMIQEYYTNGTSYTADRQAYYNVHGTLLGFPSRS